MPHDFITRAKSGEVLINNVAFKIEGPIGWGIENSYSKGIRQGDAGPQDHPIDSTISQASWTGGVGTKRYRGDDTKGNSWWSTMWLLTEDVLSLPPKTLTHTLAGEEVNFHWPHEKLGGFQYASFGKKMRVWDEAVDDFIAISGNPASTGLPVGKGVTWGNDITVKRLYIPMGSTYETFNGSTFSAGTVGEGAIGFVVWQQKLFKVDSNGIIKVTTDGAAWSEKGRIPEDFTPRRLFIHYNKNNERTVHLATSGKLYALDYDNLYLVERELEYPDHPEQGKGATIWRADAYISVGLGVHRDSNGQISAIGPDGRDGLPEDYQTGSFVDLAPSYNELLGLLKGGDLAFVPAVETSDVEAAPPQAMYSQTGQTGFAALMGWNGLGWYPKKLTTAEPTGIVVSSNSGVYRVFWGDRGHMYSQILPIGYYNASYNQNQTPLERYARHETPFFNFGVDDVPKIIKQFEIRTRHCDANNYLVVWCRLDEEDEWGDGQTPGTPLATITTDGEHHLDIGREMVADRLSHLGLEVEKIQFAIDAYGDPADEYATPIINWYTIVGRKWMRPFFSWDFQIDATKAYNNLSPYEQWKFIYAAATKKGGSTLVIGDEVYEVDITSDQGNRNPDPNWSGYITLSAILMQEVDA